MSIVFLKVIKNFLKIQFDRMINKKAKYPEDFNENAYKNFLKLSNTRRICFWILFNIHIFNGIC